MLCSQQCYASSNAGVTVTCKRRRSLYVQSTFLRQHVSHPEHTKGTPFEGVRPVGNLRIGQEICRKCDNYPVLDSWAVFEYSGRGMGPGTNQGGRPYWTARNSETGEWCGTPPQVTVDLNLIWLPRFRASSHRPVQHGGGPRGVAEGCLEHS